VEVEPVFIDTGNEAASRWKATVPYTAVGTGSQPPVTGESVYNFEVSGETKHITQSLATIASYPTGSGSATPDFKGAVNVNDQGVDGVDIQVGTFGFSETHYISDAAVTESYKTALAGLVYHVNDDTFRGHAAGEVLFIGASGTKRGDEDWEITYRFEVSKNVTGLAVGDLTGISKKGWEYLWVRYKAVKDATANVLVRVPEFAYVERVYDKADFADIGIDTGS
jgi:hypothetical protein